MRTSALGITQLPKGLRESAQDFKFAKLTTNMAVQGLLRKTLFPPSLVSCLRYHLFLSLKTSILQAISNEKNIVLNCCAGT